MKARVPSGRLAASRLPTSRPHSAAGRRPAGNAVPVTADNFIRAETDMYFGGVVKRQAASASSRTTASRRRSTSTSCARTATRCIRWRCSISTRGR